MYIYNVCNTWSCCSVCGLRQREERVGAGQDHRHATRHRSFKASHCMSLRSAKHYKHKDVCSSLTDHGVCLTHQPCSIRMPVELWVDSCVVGRAWGGPLRLMANQRPAFCNVTSLLFARPAWSVDKGGTRKSTRFYRKRKNVVQSWGKSNRALLELYSGRAGEEVGSCGRDKATERVLRHFTSFI